MADTDDLFPSHGEAEHELISTSLEIEQLDTNLYRSKSLWLPSEARGVIGGYVPLDNSKPFRALLQGD